MVRDPVAFEEIRVNRAPGFEREGFTTPCFSPGVNVVHGPNAAGKTTLARAIEGLLWPEKADESVDLVGTFSVGSEPWNVQLKGGTGSYQHNGVEAERPTLPAAEQRDRYRLSLHDFLQRETQNESFAAFVEQESMGGHDLPAAHRHLGYTDTASTGRKKEVTAAKKAVDEWRDLRNAAADLEEEHQRLTKLESNLEKARQAQEHVVLFEQVEKHADARGELAEAEARLAELPGVLAEMDGDEYSEVEEIKGKLDKLEAERDNAVADRNAAETEIENADLPADGVSPGLREQLEDYRDQLRSLEDKQGRLESKLRGARDERATAREDIPLDVEHEQLVDLDLPRWRTVVKFVESAETVQRQRRNRQRVEEKFTESDRPEEDHSELRRGSEDLETWLATPAPDATGREAYRVAAFSAAILGVLGVGLGVFVSVALAPLVLVAVGLFLYGRRVARGTDDADDREQSQSGFEQTGLAAPDTWTATDVRDRLFELYEALSEHEAADRCDQVRERVLAEFAVSDDEQRRVDETRSDLRDRLGGDVGLTAVDEDIELTAVVEDIELTVVTKRIIDWQEAHDEVVRLEGELEGVSDQQAEVRSKLEAELDPFGFGDVQDVAEATGAIRDLKDRIDADAEATRELKHARREIEEADEEIDRLDEEWTKTFTDVGLDPGDTGELRRLCDQVDAYTEASTAVEKANVLATEAESDLQTTRGFEEHHLEMERPTAETKLRREREIAKGYDEIQSQITKIETRVEDAKRDDQAESARTGKERALDELQVLLENDYGALVGDVLVDHVQTVAAEDSLPDVFRRAREILATITNGAFELTFDENTTSFRAIDTAEGVGYALDELSSGTRVQVLLAVRLAFVEGQEHGVAPPLVLDETLANSDDRRATAVVESVIELARAGRQVFYFTAQGDEVAKWKAALDGKTDVEYLVVDLANDRETVPSVEVPSLPDVASEPPAAPSIEGHDYVSYGDALDVDAFDPRAGIAGTHLWYVADDLDTLHHLLSLGVERWGQLENLLDHAGVGSVGLGRERVASIRVNVAALNAFTEAWSVGRGKHVDRQTLDATSAVSSKFIDRVTDLAESVDGDGERIIEALRDDQVTGFWRSKKNELETYFEENGYINPEDTLDETEVRNRVVSSLVDNEVPREEATKRTTELLTRLAR